MCCETCFAHVKGDIRKLSIQLKEKLGNFHLNAKRFETLLEDLERTPVTNRFLTRFNMEWQNIIDVNNAVTVSRMVTDTALLREESRGAHYRDDFPDTDNENWLVNIFLRKEKETGISLSREPVALTRLKREEIGDIKY